MMRVSIFVFAMTLALTAANPALARWIKAETQNFVIYSESSEKSLRDYAEKLQRFDATLRFRFNVAPGADSVRLPIYLVERAEEAGRLATGKGGSMIAGFYSPHPEGSYAVSNREDYGGRGTSDAQQTLFHEYAHHFMKRYVTAAFPAWFIEGFAEFYSTVDFTKDYRAEIGKPVYRRAYGLLEMPKIPAERLLNSRPGEMRTSGMMDSYYGRSWLMTHMLLNDPARASQLTKYIEAINNGTDAKQAATDHFGDLAQLDRDLNRYMSRPLTYRTTTAPIVIPGEIVLTTLSPSENAILELRLERISADDDEVRLGKVRDALTKLSAEHGGDANLWFELGAAQWAMPKDKRDAAAARSAVERAIAIAPTHVRANVLLGQMIAAELDEKSDYSAASWRRVRAPITLANRTDPDDPLPLYAYFRSFADQGVNPPDIALQGLERAFGLARENLGPRVSHAFALANKGKFDDALKLAQSVAFDPHDDGGGQALLDQLERMKARAEGRDMPEAEPTASAKTGE